jgi:hypothetical protein
MARSADRVLGWLLAVPPWAQALAALLVGALFTSRVWTVYADTGLFRRIGFDWGLFYSQAAAFSAGHVGGMYQLETLNPYLQRLLVFTTTPDVPLLQWPSPYPPLFAALVAPLTLLPPQLGFAIWTGLGVICACHLAWRIAQLIPTLRGWRAIVLVLISLPVLQVLLLGQPVLLLASALAESFMALRRGADVRGGVWLGLLAIKPQYALFLGLFLLWKRRWRAVAGAAAVLATILLLSAAIAGPRSVLDYQVAVSAMGDFRDEFAKPAEMVNFRALIVNLRPAIGHTTGVVLFAALSGLTVLAIALATRGRWQPGSQELDLQLAAVLVGTMLVSYHSHMHGLALLAVPLAAAWSAAQHAPLKLAILGLVFVPTLAFIWVTAIMRGLAIDYEQPLWVVWPVLTIVLLVLVLGATLVELSARRAAAAVERQVGDVVLSAARNA